MGLEVSRNQSERQMLGPEFTRADRSNASRELPAVLDLNCPFTWQVQIVRVFLGCLGWNRDLSPTMTARR